MIYGHLEDTCPVTPVEEAGVPIQPNRLRAARRRWAERLPERYLRWLLRVRHLETPVLQRALRARDRIARAPEGCAVHQFDADATARAAADEVAAALDRSHIPYVAVPGPHDTVRTIAISDEHRQAAWQVLGRELSGPEWAADVLAGELRLRTGRRVRPGHRLPAKATGAVLYRLLTSEAGVVSAGPELGCEIGFWKPTGPAGAPRKDGGRHAPGTYVAPADNGVVAYLTPQAWSDACTETTHWVRPKTIRSIFEFDEPIDIVYTWVDGDDPQWQARKAHYAHEADLETVNESSAIAARFQSRDELRYSLRSVAMYAPWVRHVYVVTDRQVPPWLNVEHPQLTVVDHREIFRDPSVLPVFNSHAIESQLHHIPGLSEHYLYLNDDFFFGRPVQPELFFHANGIAKFFLSAVVLDVDPPSRRDLPVLSAAKQNRALIEKEFGVTITQKLKHTPQPQIRSVVREMERRHPDAFEAVARSRFRHPDDLSIPSALVHYYAYGLGKAVPADIAYRYQDVGYPDTKRRLDLMLRRRDVDVFCLNDTDSETPQTAAQLEMLGAFLDRYYPHASRFERP